MLRSLHYFNSLNRNFSKVAKTNKTSTMAAVKTVLIDISGTLHIEDQEIPGSIEALKRLQETDLTVKFVTNTSKESRKELHQRLMKLGFAIEIDDIYTSLAATRDFIKKEQLKPLFLLENDTLENDFPGFSSFDGEPDSVVVALAPSQFTRANLNKSLRILLGGGTLVAANQAKYYRQSDGLSLGAGAFVKALEYASKTKAVTLGKPTANFFKFALDKVPPAEAIMIGDDVKDDILGAQIIGMRGYLVKTGKYLKGDENKINPPPFKVVNSMSDAADDIISLLS